MILQSNPEILKFLYSESKFYAPFISGLWALFKVVNWFKEIKDNHIPHLQAGIDELNKKVDSQTDTICEATKTNTREIVELRGDIRQLTTTLIAGKSSGQSGHRAEQFDNLS